MELKFDVAKLPDGEVEALVYDEDQEDLVWKNVAMTDVMFIEEMAELDELYPKAKAFRFTKDGHRYFWERDSVNMA